MSDNCQVYIIAHMKGRNPVAPVKIGISSDPQKRLASLQTANPNPLVLLCTFWTPSRVFAKELEGAFHYVKRDTRLAGEWFDMSPMQAIQAMCSNFRGCFARFLADDEAGHRQALEVSGVLEAEQKLAQWQAYAMRHLNDNPEPCQ